MLIENGRRFWDVVGSRDPPCWRDNYWDITDVKGAKFSNMLRGYPETNIIHKEATVDFVLEDVNKK
jgi:hypothetical protein